MNPAVRVALLGFTDFERNHIEAALQPADGPGRHFCVAGTLAACNVAVANADDDSAVAQVMAQGRLASTVMLGNTPRAGAAAQLPRPISLVHLLRALDQLVDSAPPMSAAVQRVHEVWGRMLAAASPPVRAASARPAPVAAALSATAAMPLIQGRTSARTTASAPALAPAWVVDNSDEVWRFLSSQLPHFGYQAHLLSDCGQALDRLNREPCGLVFLATGLDGVDCFHACRTIKRSSYPANRQPPRVVMLLSRDSAVDEVRAEMAQADGWLLKPLREPQLAPLFNRLQPTADNAWQLTHAGTHHRLSSAP
jgi:two-component system, cell cycle response regulator